MFTGIVQKTVSIISTRNTGGLRCVHIKTPARWRLSSGQSVAVDGICSTVARKGNGFFEVEYVHETLMKTTAGKFIKGKKVNLERSLKYGGFIDGHFVQGHVDTRGRVVAIVERGKAKEYVVSLPRALMPFIVRKGSVAVNGVSLTVARRGEASFTIALIPHTLASTNLVSLNIGDEVNIETDMLARYAVAVVGVSGTVIPHAKKRARQKIHRR